MTLVSSVPTDWIVIEPSKGITSQSLILSMEAILHLFTSIDTPPPTLYFKSQFSVNDPFTTALRTVREYFERLPSTEPYSVPYSVIHITHLSDDLIMRIFSFLPWKGMECMTVPYLDQLAFSKKNRPGWQMSLDID